MKKPIIKNNTPFKVYYESLPANAKTDFISEVMIACEISEPTFYRRLAQPEFFSNLEKKAIAALAGKRASKLFPDQAKAKTKKLAIIVILLLSLLSKGQTGNYIPDAPPIDKMAHFGAGFIISSTIYHIVEDKKKAFTIAFASGVGVGFLKEGFDYSQGRPFSWGDIKATAFGALAGTVSYKIIINLKQKAKGDYSAWENIGAGGQGIFDKEEERK